MRFLSIIVIALGLASAAFAAEGPTITVTGHGEAAAAPDTATITLGVTSQAKTAGAAMDEASAAAAAIMQALEAAGIDARDMQTSELSLDPVWSGRGANGDGTPRIEGFTARNTLRVRVRDLERLGTVLDDVLRVGANTFRGLSFGLQEPEPLADQARAEAVADAQRKAALMAEAAGVALGPVLSIRETGGVSPQPVMMEAARAAVPVAAGEVSQTATVTMVFALGG